MTYIAAFCLGEKKNAATSLLTAAGWFRTGSALSGTARGSASFNAGNALHVIKPAGVASASLRTCRTEVLSAGLTT